MQTGRETTFRSRDGQAVLRIHVREFPPDLAEDRFAREHRASVIAKNAYSVEQSGGYFDINVGEGFHKDNAWRFRLAWRLQADANSCVMDIVDIIFRSRYFPARPYGYVMGVSICDEHLDAYRKVRERILVSFEENKLPEN